MKTRFLRHLFLAALVALSAATLPARASKGDTFENEILPLIFNNSNVANVGDATGLRGSTTAGSLFVALHTADPGEAGAQSASEAAYAGYARVAVARSGAGWTVTGNSVSPAANIDFGECTASCSATITHWSVGVSSSGATKVLYKGAISPNIALAVGVIPRVRTTSTITED